MKCSCLYLSQAWKTFVLLLLKQFCWPLPFSKPRSRRTCSFEHPPPPSSSNTTHLYVSKTCLFLYFHDIYNGYMDIFIMLLILVSTIIINLLALWIGLVSSLCLAQIRPPLLNPPPPQETHKKTTAKKLNLFKMNSNLHQNTELGLNATDQHSHKVLLRTGR